VIRRLGHARLVAEQLIRRLDRLPNRGGILPLEGIRQRGPHVARGRRFLGEDGGRASREGRHAKEEQAEESAVWHEMT
jgi:hypothetical protein